MGKPASQETKTQGKTEQIEYEEITIKVPKQVISFLKAHVEDPEEYIEVAPIRVLNADLNNDQFFFSLDHITQLYHLKPVFKHFNVG